MQHKNHHSYLHQLSVVVNCLYHQFLLIKKNHKIKKCHMLYSELRTVDTVEENGASRHPISYRI